MIGTSRRLSPRDSDRNTTPLASKEDILRDYLKDRKGGIFVDVGAFHAKDGSNTYRLERDFGWTGLAIDANPAFAQEYHALSQDGI